MAQENNGLLDSENMLKVELNLDQQGLYDTLNDFDARLRDAEERIRQLEGDE